MRWIPSLQWKTKTKRAKDRRVRPMVEILEDRTTPAVMSVYETYALQIVNQLRDDPAAFAADLQQLYQGGNYQSPYGYHSSDPIWTDLREMIDAAELHTSWESGFNSAGPNTFLSVATALSEMPPLVWDAIVQDGAVGHNDWMFANVYAHSIFNAGDTVFAGESPGNQIPGLTRNFSAPGDLFSVNGFLKIGENISYAYNDQGATYQAFRNGDITQDGYYQRLVYADVIGYIMEFNNGNPSLPWGHLENLVDSYNVVGIDLLFYENPIETHLDGTAQSYFGTQRFAERGGVSFASIFVYQDANSNGVFDVGEQLDATVTVNGFEIQINHGYGVVQIANTGGYLVEVSVGGTSLGSQSFVANGTTRSLVFNAAPSVDLTAPVSQVAPLPLYDWRTEFSVKWSGSDVGSGIASYTIYVSIDGGAFTPWLSDTTATQATFTGEVGRTYRFFSVAVDHAGNVQATPSGAQATIEVRTFPGNPSINREQFSAALTHSDEQFSNFIRAAYQQYLGRLPDASGLNYWLSLMRVGAVTDERLESNFIGSNEYIANHGGYGAGWVTGMYQDLLGRNPGSGEVQFWVQRLVQGMSPADIAYGFAASIERTAQRVTQNYQQYLGRSPQGWEVNYWVNLFINHGMTTETMAAGFVGSNEYFHNPNQGQSSYPAWLDQAYRTILGRPPTLAEMQSVLG